MKISFLSPANYNIPYKRQIGPTLGIAYMASLIENKLGINDISIDIDLESLLRKKPDLVAIPVYTEDYNRAIAYAREIKKHLNVPIIAGGPHFTALPETLHETIDIGVVGEGEEIMLDLATLHHKNGLTHENLQHITGIVYHHEGEKYFTPKRVLGKLDDLPMPNRKVMKTYWPELQKHQAWEQGIYTSRGCPFKCIFCQYSKIRKNVRYHSISRIMADIEDIIREFPHQGNIIIFDDLFVMSKKRLHEIVKAIREEKIHKKVTFGCMARASVFDEEICQLLRDMNINVISFGFETGSEEVLKYLKVDASTIRENQNAIDLCSKYGINAGGYFIVGAPVETREDLAQTYWFIRKNIKDMPIAGTFCISPIPGTVVWDYAYERGLIAKDAASWDRINYMDLKHDKYIFLNEHYSYEDMMQAYRELQYIVDKPDKFSGIYKAQALLKQYKENVIKDVENYITADKILEVGEHIKYLRQDDQSVSFLSYRNINDGNWQEIAEKKFDCIFINHVLEKLINPYDKLENLFAYLNPGGKIIILFSNSATEETLNNLLNGWKYDWTQLRELDSLNFLTIRNFSSQLSARKIKYEILNAYSSDLPVSENLKLASSFIDIKNFLEVKNTFSYLVSLPGLQSFY